MARYASLRRPKVMIGAATAYVTSCSCQTARPPVGRRTVAIPGRSSAGSFRPSDRQGGSQRYSLRKDSPELLARSSRASSVAMFCTPERPSESMERWNVGKLDRFIVPSFHRSIVPSNVRICLNWGTDTHQVPVSVGAIHSAHRRPDLVVARGSRGERRALTAVGPVPRVREQVGERVRCLLEEIVLPVRGPRLDLLDLFTDRDQRIAETIELRLRLALRRLHHQRTRDGERHRRRMEAIVDEPL